MFQMGRELGFSNFKLTPVLGKVPKWSRKEMGWGYLEMGVGHLARWGPLGTSQGGHKEFSFVMRLLSRYAEGCRHSHAHFNLQWKFS